jgi:Asp-tRNA(Asn)/Glu-tRNA(Gln) amidotransferase A subunit family amidase
MPPCVRQQTRADMLAFWDAIGRPTGRGERLPIGAPDPLPVVDPEMAYAFTNTLAQLKKDGHGIRSVDIAPMLAKLNEAAQTISTYEGARAHEERFKEYGDRLDDVAGMVRAGSQISEAQYSTAKQYVAECRLALADLYKETPVILVPAAPGPAPLGLSSTGDARMNRPWTALGTPAISIPMKLTKGLPLGLQLTANPGDDARVLRAAVSVEQSLRSE